MNNLSSPPTFVTANPLSGTFADGSTDPEVHVHGQLPDGPLNDVSFNRALVKPAVAFTVLSIFERIAVRASLPTGFVSSLAVGDSAEVSVILVFRE